MRIGPHFLDGWHVFIVAELGANHNGDVATCLKMLDAAKAAGADAVKFQKRTPELCIPKAQQAVVRDTPWGPLDYLSYRQRLEFDEDQYAVIAARCRELGLLWSASAWDEPSLDFVASFQPPFLKIPSACLTDDDLLRAAQATGIPVFLSTGMSTLAQIDHAVLTYASSTLVLLHCTSTYPAPPAELNLRCIPMLRARYGLPIGFSGHETGLSTTLAAVVLGAVVVERHFTLDRSWFGTDQAASLEPEGFRRLVRDIRKWEVARGDGVKRVFDSEVPVMEKLRRVR